MITDDDRLEVLRGFFAAIFEEEDRTRPKQRAMSTQFADEAVLSLQVDLNAWTAKNESLLVQASERGLTWEQAGEAFFQSRNGVGKGFQDEDLALGDLGDALHEAALKAGRVQVDYLDNGFYEINVTVKKGYDNV